MRTGIRMVDELDGGVVAWLQPGLADLDEVMLELADWLRLNDLDARHIAYARVGHYRRFPWCTCGEGHSWHIEPSDPGPGASVAVMLDW